LDFREDFVIGHATDSRSEKKACRLSDLVYTHTRKLSRCTKPDTELFISLELTGIVKPEVGQVVQRYILLTG
jgi:hypothetical protein